MSVSLTEAITASIASDLNPMNAATADYVKESVVKLKASNVQLKLDQMQRIQALIDEAGDNAKASVIRAYEDMLQKLISM